MENFWYKTSKIKKNKGKYQVTDESGTKNLGKYDTKDEALKRLRQVEYFKNKKSNIELLEKIADFDQSFKSNDNKTIGKILDILKINQNDSPELKITKRKAITALDPLLKISSPEFAEEWIKINSEKINKIISAMGEKGFEQIASQEINLDDYDLIVFDADNTIWDGDVAKDMQPPFVKIDDNIIKDKDGKVCRLKEGFKKILLKLRALDKDIGMITHSENTELNHEDQPVLKLLKMFDIMGFFNEMIVILSDLPKSMFIPSDRRVLFIDDDIYNLWDVLRHTEADILPAGKEDKIIASDEKKKSKISL